MSASAYRGRRLLASALTKAGAWLIEPAGTAGEPVEETREPVEVRARPVVAVVGLAAGSGATTVARALGVELGVRDCAGAAVVAGEGPAGSIQLGGAAAGRIARALGDPDGGAVRPAGRLCLVSGASPPGLARALRHLAPLVLDVGHGKSAGVSASLADHVLLVASPGVEPALAPVVASALARVGPDPFVVLNRAAEGDEWDGRASARLPHSRAGAHLAWFGREPRGALGTAVADLADACETTREAW